MPNTEYSGKVYKPTADKIVINAAGASPGLIEATGEYTGTASYQPIAVDLALGGAIGAEGKKLSPVMGNVVNRATPAAITTKPIVAGVIGAYSLTNASSSTYPLGAVAAQISDAVNDGKVNGVVAYIDGDSAVTKANAAFKAMSNNSVPGSGFDFGVDLFGSAHDGYSELAILKADIRLSKEVCLLNGAGAPTDGASGTGAGVAEKGSIYIDRTNGKLYVNGGTKASPTWKLVTSAA